jgi:TolB-like protein/Tfp pilus assembly protein PilF
MSFFNELKRRNVIRVGLAYLATTWLLIQVLETLLPIFGLPATSVRVIVIVLAIGFVPVMVFAWVFELSPDGLKRDAGIDRALTTSGRANKHLDRAIMVVLALALGYFAFDKFVLDPARDLEMVGEATVQARADALIESFGEYSIAVLAFSDMSPEGDQEYLSDGIAEELLNLLAKIPELRVVSRSSAFSFKGQDIDIPTVAKRLNVAHVLEGSVQKSGNRIRISAKLIEARTDTHMWSKTYDRTLDDIFAIQDEISGDVVEQLKVTLLGDLPKGQQTDPQAYSLYLQGKYFNDVRGKENLEKAIVAFKEALTIDPNYAPAWAGLHLTYSLQIYHGHRTKEENFALAMEAAKAALAIDENTVTALAGLAYMRRTYEWDWQGASDAIQRALKLEPNNVQVLITAAAISSTLGRLPESIELYERTVELDPLGFSVLASLGARYRNVGRFDDALSAYQRVLTLNPNYPGIRSRLSQIYLLKGDPERALTELERDPDYKYFAVSLARIEHTLGNEAKARSHLNELLDEGPDDFSYGLALIYAWRGENDAAFEWLERAYRRKNFRLAYFLGNSWFRSLTTDPRYPIFVEKLGLLQEWKAMPPEHGGPPRPPTDNDR